MYESLRMDDTILPQERIPQSEQDLDEGRSNDFLENFDLNTFLSAPPETRHDWQAEFEQSWMRGANNAETSADGQTSFADGEQAIHVVPGPSGSRTRSLSVGGGLNRLRTEQRP